MAKSTRKRIPFTSDPIINGFSEQLKQNHGIKNASLKVRKKKQK
jgi:hypothetical protein